MKRSFLVNAIIITIALGFITCSGNGGLSGAWESEAAPYIGKTRWVFSGNNLTQEIAGVKQTVKYSVKGNNIVMEQQGAKMEIEYKIDGDTLYLTMSGFPIELKRVAK